LGVTGGRLSIRDLGALPFVISARIEAAVRRAGFRERPSPKVAPLSSWDGTEILHQRRPAWAGRDHSGP
jgi:hypothetical protein